MAAQSNILSNLFYNFKKTKWLNQPKTNIYIGTNEHTITKTTYIRTQGNYNSIQISSTQRHWWDTGIMNACSTMYV